MLSSKVFWQVITGAGFSFFAGVPCSILKPILNNLPRGTKYLAATREDNALGLASGAYLAGNKGAILIQNSGLGNVFNGLTSFNLIYKIPILMIITWRGEVGKPDAPEHDIMGKVMLPALELLKIPYKIIDHHFEKQIKWAIEVMEKKRIPVALVLKEGAIG